MANSKTTKKALFTSMMSLLLCFTMLMGTTFAWFTDSVKSANNIIKSGNLDIDVQYTLDGENWKDLDGADDLFKKGLWEPGHTEVVVLKIENKGSLALKYNANMNIISEAVGKTKDGANIVLSDILTVSTCTQQYTDGNGNVASGADIFPAMAFNNEGGMEGWIGYQTTSTFKTGNVLKSDKQLQPKEADYIAVKVDMAETVTNEANHNGIEVPAIEFGINVLATQFTYENDSFGPDYDEGASVEDAIFEHGGVYEMTADRYENVYIAENADVIINGNDYSIIKDGAVGFENYGNATLNNVKMDAGSVGDYSNICRAGSETVYNEVDIHSKGGGIGVTGGGKVIFNSGSLEIDTKSTSGRYLFYAVGTGSQIVINGGNFDFNKTQNQKRAYIYADVGATVYVNGGTFGKASTRSGYTAGILGEGTVIITGGTFGFDPTKWVPAEGYSITKENGSWTVTVK